MLPSSSGLRTRAIATATRSRSATSSGLRQCQGGSLVRLEGSSIYRNKGNEASNGPVLAGDRGKDLGSNPQSQAKVRRREGHVFVAACVIPNARLTIVAGKALYQDLPGERACASQGWESIKIKPLPSDPSWPLPELCSRNTPVHLIPGR